MLSGGLSYSRFLEINMKKRILLSSIALCFAVLGAMAQRGYNFNAVALNVDGLPESILGITINEGAPGEDGAKELCAAIANSGWDFCGFSEDFNYHSALTGAPANSYYNFGTHGGSVSGLSNPTDGLGFACLKRHTMSGGTRVAWDTHYGETSDGADGLINKGFRVYTVTFATGVAVDVYVLHMDASDGSKDIAARESQLTQLATYIKNNHNNRPVIVLGDTNCRYTREQLKTKFIDVINADSRFTIKDAWVEHMWNGVYPTYGSDAMMTHAYGDQKGEVVDKIFYINTTASNLTLKANSYLHDTSIAVSDHYPVVVNFTLTDPNGTPLTDAEKENNWTLDLSDGGEPAPTFMGVQPENGKAYFLKNVSTGLYLKWGAEYGARGILGSAGVAFTFKQSGSNWILKTSDNSSLLGDPGTWLDNGGENVWTLEVVPGTEYQYYIRNSFGTLSPLDNDAFNRVNAVAHNANDDRQKWVLLTPEKVKTEMLQGNGTFPYDVTPLFRAADFDRFDGEYGIYSYWTGADASTIGGIWWEGAEGYNGCAAIVNTKKSTSLSQTISGMPAGTYKISFEAFYRDRKTSWGSTKDQTMNATVTVGGLTFQAKQNTGTAISTDRYVPGVVFRDNDTYAQAGTFTLNSTGSITFKITNPSTTGNNWVCLDNIKLVYSATGFSDPYLEYKKAIINRVNETYEEVIELNEAGQAAYDITVAVNRVKDNQVTSPAEVEAMCNLVDKAYANAYAAHLAYYVEQAIDQMEQNGGDLTGAIVNPSFETGDLTGWTVGEAWDLGARETSNATYASEGSDGNYLFNAYSGDHGHTTSVMQTIKGVPNGLYELKAMMTSHGATENIDANNPKTQANRVYLVGNDYHSSIAAEHRGQFEEGTLYFLVEDGTAVIGAIGGNKGGGADFIHYWPWQGCFFKADNFRLKYICDVPHGRLKLALDEVAATDLDAYGLAALNISAYQSAYDNKSLTTDGKTEAAAVRSALQTATKAQRTKNADMTWAITNPSFETGDYTGWSTTVGWDTNVHPQQNGTYTIAGTDGRYMFNTWNNDGNATNSGVNAAITQTVTGIPNGTYKVSAMVATDAGNSMKLTANGKTTTIAASTNGASSGVFPSVECEVTNGTLAIEVVGVNNCWYKCDDFRLTYLGHEGTLSESDGVTADDWYTSLGVTRTMKKDTWHTFVVPFDMAIPEDWKVKELTNSTVMGDAICLEFGDAETIKAGVAYMIRVGSDVSSLPTLENVQVITKLENPSTSHVEFVGVYKAGKIPTGAFFISNNTFYQAADDTNTIKAFRAYFMAKSSAASARALSYRFDGEEGTTAIDNSQLTNDNEVTVVGIYTLGGVRINDMQEGVNILQMSNGTTVKVVIK